MDKFSSLLFSKKINIYIYIYNTDTFGCVKQVVETYVATCSGKVVETVVATYEELVLNLCCNIFAKKKMLKQLLQLLLKLPGKSLNQFVEQFAGTPVIKILILCSIVSPSR
jgi:hypothetical protein